MFRDVLHEERGTILPITLFFFFIVAGFLSMLLLIEQVDLLDMRTQQMADIVTKGARSAGEWVYVTPAGEEEKVLFATRKEAREYGADIVRGAREEAELLYEFNKERLMQSGVELEIDHQKGERKSLYWEGKYHVSMTSKQRAMLMMEEFDMKVHRTSQSGFFQNR